MLTPRSKRLQEGSRAVARQLTTDILPLLMKPPSVGPGTRRGSPSGSSSSGSVDIPKVSNRILNALTNQVQSNLQILQEDLANPRRIPARLNRGLRNSRLSSLHGGVNEHDGRGRYPDDG